MNIEIANSDFVRVTPEYQTLFEGLPAMILIVKPNPEFTVVTMTQAYLDGTMQTRANLIGRSVFESVPDDQGDPTASGLRASLERVMRTGREDFKMTQKYSAQDRTGEFKPHSWTLLNSPIFDSSGNLLYIVHRVEKIADYIQMIRESAATESIEFDPESRLGLEICQRTLNLQGVNEQLRVPEKSLMKGRADLIELLVEKTHDLEQSIERTRFAMETATLGEWSADFKTQKAFQSLQHAQCFGLSEPLPQWDLETFVSFLHPDDRPRVCDILQTSLKTLEVIDYECRVVWPDSTVHWIAVRGRYIFNESKDPISVHGVISDITKRKVKEAALESSQRLLEGSKAEIENERENFRNLFRQTPEMVCMLHGPTHVFEFVNEAHVKVLGFDATGLDIRTAQPESLEIFDILDEAYRSGVSARLREIPVTVGSKLRYFNLTYCPRFHPDGKVNGVMVLGSEVTQQIEARNLILKAKNDADAANNSKTAFIANMSHEIRTPLGVISGFCELLQDENLGALEKRDYLSRVVKNTKGLTRIIDDILDLAKVEAGKMEIEQINFSLMDLLSEVFEMFHDRALAKKISFDLKIENTIPSIVHSDPTRLRQILINIIGNAIKFTTQGFVEIEASSKRIDIHRLKIEVRIKDSGIGLSADQANKLFEPFVQADGSTSRVFGGTGLGLAISRRLAHALDGNIEIEKFSEGQGCTFLISFYDDSQLSGPIDSSAINRVSLIRTGPPSAQNALANLRILVAEDSIDNQILVKRILSKNGAAVEIANNGEEAIEKALSANFDLILMDVQMPRVDGCEAARALRKGGLRTPIVALTAHAMLEEKIRTREAGCDAHLTKPINASELVDTIRSLTQF